MSNLVGILKCVVLDNTIPITITKDANELDWETEWDRHTSYDAYTDVAITIDDTQDEFNSWTQDIIEKSDSIIGQQRLWRQLYI